MTDALRTQALTDAIEALEWFTPARTIDRIIGVYAEATSDQPTQLPAGKTAGELAEWIALHERGPSTSTVTERAAFTQQDRGDDPTISAIDACVTAIRGIAQDIDWLCAEALGQPRTLYASTSTGLQADLDDALAHLHHARPVHVDAYNLLGRDGQELLDDMIRSHLTDTASWLQVKCEALHGALKVDQRLTAQDRPHTECCCCKGHGVTGTTATIDGASGPLCARCARFQSDNKCLPSQQIVRAWDRGSKSIPNGWVIEAIASSRPNKARKVKAS